jgi:hypothetical protein
MGEVAYLNTEEPEYKDGGGEEDIFVCECGNRLMMHDTARTWSYCPICTVTWEFDD